MLRKPSGSTGGENSQSNKRTLESLIHRMARKEIKYVFEEKLEEFNKDRDKTREDYEDGHTDTQTHTHTHTHTHTLAKEQRLRKMHQKLQLPIQSIGSQGRQCIDSDMLEEEGSHRI